MEIHKAEETNGSVLALKPALWPVVYHPYYLVRDRTPGDYGNGIFQAGYACDRFERVWRELQFQGPEVVREQVLVSMSASSSK